MRALITGVAGFVGPHLARELTAAGHEVVGLDLKTGPDLLDSERWAAVVGQQRPDAIYHLAGWSDVGRSWQEPIPTFQVNALGTMSVLEAAAAASVARVLVVSSADVYGTVAPEQQPIAETHPLQPRSPYGVSKQSAEALAMRYARACDLGVIVVRPFNHVGPGQSTRFAAPAFAAQIAEAERRGGGEVVHGDLQAKRDLTDVRDVVRAYRLLVEAGEPGEVYNVCSGIAVTMESVLAMLVEKSKVPIQTALDPSRLRPIELPVLQGSRHKLTSATGWEPALPLGQTLTDVLEDARARIAV
jgi:GDP-4-dehydro-6-deoxy-D-mannose reductase